MGTRDFVTRRRYIDAKAVRGPGSVIIYARPAQGGNCLRVLLGEDKAASKRRWARETLREATKFLYHQNVSRRVG